jgi:hypothetical protein
MPKNLPLEELLSRSLVPHHRQPIPSRPGKTSAAPARTDDNLVKRIAASYAVSSANSASAGNSQWSLFMWQFNQPIHEALLQNDLATVSEALRNPAQNNLFYGFENIRIDYTRQCAADPNDRLWYVEQIHDNLLRLAEAVGAVPIANPEASNRNAASYLPAESILAKLDERFGFRIDFPNPYPDEYGLETERGIASYRAIHALWQAWRIQDNLNNPQTARVLEIGAGLGRTAYYAQKFGIGSYCIVDIPFTAISSAYFLASTLGEDRIHLFGEPQTDAPIRIMTPEAFLALDGPFDLIANFDSFTEIDQTMAVRYWDKIFNVSSVFLSVNHEANAFRVADFYLRRSEIYKAERHPCWLRSGYLEEIVRLRM